MKTMQRQLTEQLRRSGRGWRRHSSLWLGFLSGEAEAWAALARTAGTHAAAWAAPGTLERQVLTGVDSVLTRMHRSVAERLQNLDRDFVTQPPLSGYQEMTARAILAELPKLSEEECRAIMAFEADHKARATVLRAAEGRLAA